MACSALVGCCLIGMAIDLARADSLRGAAQILQGMSASVVYTEAEWRHPLNGTPSDARALEATSDDRCCPADYTGLRAFDRCTQFYHCVSGAVVGDLQTCPTDTLFNENIQVCDHEHDFECGEEHCTTAPTPSPTSSPTVPPTAAPTRAPTAPPTGAPTSAPTAAPTSVPTAPPTAAPSSAPTAPPTAVPTRAPTAAPTAAPTRSPTAPPTAAPTQAPRYTIVQNTNVRGTLEDSSCPTEPTDCPEGTNQCGWCGCGKVGDAATACCMAWCNERRDCAGFVTHPWGGMIKIIGTPIARCTERRYSFKWHIKQ